MENYTPAVKTTRAREVLEFIREKGTRGATLKEIQTFVLRKKGLIGPTEDRPHEMRGWWIEPLYGSIRYTPGILYLFCTKNPATQGWVLTEDIPVSPLRINGRITKTLIANRALRRGEEEERLKKFPICKNCGRRNFWKEEDGTVIWSPDYEACLISDGIYGRTDCKKRFWSPSGRLTSLAYETVNAAGDVLHFAGEKHYADIGFEDRAKIVRAWVEQNADRYAQAAEWNAAFRGQLKNKDN